VVVLCPAAVVDSPLVREILAGLEEEGVPVGVATTDEAGPAITLAHAAARSSALDVGVGVDTTGTVCVHHAKLPPESAAVSGTAAQARVLGHNAARLVTGIPFKPVVPLPSEGDRHGRSV